LAARAVRILAAIAGDVPYPPLQLANRVGCLESAADPWLFYDELGLGARGSLEAGLPPDWSWEGKRVLDFGCGAGRTLRHFVPLADKAEFYGCDIDAESIEWLRANLSPPLNVFVNADLPPLAQPDGHFDLVYAVSVFTHLTDSWSAWLAELHRVLAPGGVALLTFMGEAMAKYITDIPWDEERTGMLVLKDGQNWDLGGPMVLHSSWWLEEHWGRAFDILSISSRGFGEVDVSQETVSQGLVAMRKREARPSTGELEAIGEVLALREARSLARHVELTRQELRDLRAAASFGANGDNALAAQVQRLSDAHAELTAELDRLRAAYGVVTTSKSWTWTAPGRRAAELLRRRGRS
jgi:SAM-dependent methyltransferase